MKDHICCQSRVDCSLVANARLVPLVQVLEERRIAQSGVVEGDDPRLAWILRRLHSEAKALSWIVVKSRMKWKNYHLP